MRGALLGLAVGDAIGAAVEFQRPGSFPPVRGMQGGGPFNLAPGEWTDDTSMALCLADSLTECRNFDPADQMERYVRWYRGGYLSSTGECFDIGNATRAALERFEADDQPFQGGYAPDAAGNAPIMRLAPIPMAWAGDVVAAIHWAGESARTTHGDERAIDAARYLAALTVGALRAESKAELVGGDVYEPVPGAWDRDPLHPEIEAVAAGSFRSKSPPAIRGKTFVVDSLEAALWAFASMSTFEDAVLAAANLGDDADTTAAVCGQLAGAFYGWLEIPAPWLEQLARREEIVDFADALRSTSFGSRLK